MKKNSKRYKELLKFSTKGNKVDLKEIKTKTDYYD